jgi:hypothetical protein
MSLRHAAALALVGWYLMVPPLLPDGSVNVKAPLSEWSESGQGFDTAQDCNKARAQEAERVVKNLDAVKREIGALPDTGDRPLSEVAPSTYARYASVLNKGGAFLSSRCISSDDPRLAK